EDVGDRVEDRITLWFDGVFAEREMDLLGDLDLADGDEDEGIFDRATLRLAVLLTRSIRALVVHVGDAVLVIVGLGTSILVLVAVEICARAGACIEQIRDAVEIIIFVRAAILVLVLVAVFRGRRAEVFRVQDPVAVRIWVTRTAVL